MANDNDEKPLLIIADVRAMQEELAERKLQRSVLDARIRKLEADLDAAKRFMDEADIKAIERAAIPREGTVSDDSNREPLPDAIKRIIREAGKPLTKIEMLSELRSDPVHAERFKVSPNYFYTAIGRLEKKHKLKRRGKKYSLPPEQNEAPPNGSGSAPKVTGEAVTSPFESQ